MKTGTTHTMPSCQLPKPRKKRYVREREGLILNKVYSMTTEKLQTRKTTSIKKQKAGETDVPSTWSNPYVNTPNSVRHRRINRNTSRVPSPPPPLSLQHPKHYSGKRKTKDRRAQVAKEHRQGALPTGAPKTKKKIGRKKLQKDTQTKDGVLGVLASRGSLSTEGRRDDPAAKFPTKVNKSSLYAQFATSYSE